MKRWSVRPGTGRPLPVALTAGEIAALVASLVALGPYSSATAVSALGKLVAALAPDVERG